MPGDDERQNLGLSAPRRHLDGVPGEEIVLQQVQSRDVRNEPLQEVLVAADAGDLIEEYQSFNGFALRKVVAEALAAPNAMFLPEPVA